MNSKKIMASSAFISGAIGLVCLFLADQIVLIELNQRSAFFEIIFQFIGILLLAVAYQNWMSKGQLIGGIYNRPLLISNMAHWMSGAIIFIKLALKQEFDPIIISFIGVYSLFAILFIRLLFISPVDQKS